MKYEKENLVPVATSLLALGTCIASTVGYQLISSGIHSITPLQLLVSAGLDTTSNIATNLLSNSLQNQFDALNKVVTRKHPYGINHDLQKTLLVTVDRSLANILFLYQDTNPDKGDMTIAKEFVDKIKPILKHSLTSPIAQDDYHKYINNYKHISVTNIKEKIIRKLGQELESMELPTGFLTLFSETFTDQLKLCFTTGLKDKSNQKSWIEFQKIMLEAIKSDLESLLEGNARIEGTLKDIQEQQFNSMLHLLTPRNRETVRKLFKEIYQPKRIRLQLNKELDALLGEIRSTLEEMKLLVEATYEELSTFRKTYEKDRVDWLSFKMVVAYGIISLLVSVMGFILYNNRQQPFMVTLQVHGPGGITDAVLKGQIKSTMELVGHPMEETLDEKGRAIFHQIPGKYKDDSISFKLAGLEGEPYRPKPVRFRLEKDITFYLPLIPVGMDKIEGTVVDERNIPIAGAIATVQGVQAITDINGWFTITLPTEKQKRLQDISIVKAGYKQELRSDVAPHMQTSRPLGIMLFKE